MKKVPVHLSMPPRDRSFASHQHHQAKHNFECSECDEEFTTEAARDEVRLLSVLLAAWPGTDIDPQHHEEEHSMVECPHCDREFANQKAVDQVCTNTLPGIFIHLTDTQHCRAKHRVECSECDREFDCEESMNKVRSTT